MDRLIVSGLIIMNILPIVRTGCKNINDINERNVSCCKLA